MAVTEARAAAVPMVRNLRRKRPIKVQMAPMALMRIPHRIKPLMVKIRPRMQLMVRLQKLWMRTILLNRQAGHLLLAQLVRLVTLAQLVRMARMAVTLMLAQQAVMA